MRDLLATFPRTEVFALAIVSLVIVASLAGIWLAWREDRGHTRKRSKAKGRMFSARASSLLLPSGVPGNGPSFGLCGFLGCTCCLLAFNPAVAFLTRFGEGLLRMTSGIAPGME